MLHILLALLAYETNGAPRLSQCSESVIYTRHALVCDGRRVAAWDTATGHGRIYHADGSIVVIDSDGTYTYLPR